MSGALGIDHLKSLAHIGFTLASLVDDAATGKGGNIFSDVYKAVSVLPDVRDALAHYTDAVAEFKDLDDTERKELYDYCISQSHFSEDKIAEDIQKALLTGCKFHEIFLIWKPAPAAGALSAAPKDDSAEVFGETHEQSAADKALETALAEETAPKEGGEESAEAKPEAGEAPAPSTQEGSEVEPSEGDKSPEESPSTPDSTHPQPEAPAGHAEEAGAPAGGHGEAHPGTSEEAVNPAAKPHDEAAKEA